MANQNLQNSWFGLHRKYLKGVPFRHAGIHRQQHRVRQGVQKVAAAPRDRHRRHRGVVFVFIAILLLYIRCLFIQSIIYCYVSAY